MIILSGHVLRNQCTEFSENLYTHYSPYEDVHLVFSFWLDNFSSIYRLFSIYGLRNFVRACSKKSMHGIFWKFVYTLLTIWRCAPGIFILIGQFFFNLQAFFIDGLRHFVRACSKKPVHGFFLKFVHSLITIMKMCTWYFHIDWTIFHSGLIWGSLGYFHYILCAPRGVLVPQGQF